MRAPCSPRGVPRAARASATAPRLPQPTPSCSRSYRRAPHRPPSPDRRRPPSSIYEATCAREIVIPCLSLPAAAPRRKVSCPSRLSSHTQRTPQALLLPLLTCLLSCACPRSHTAARHATLQRLGDLLRHRRLGDRKRRSEAAALQVRPRRQPSDPAWLRPLALQVRPRRQPRPRHTPEALPAAAAAAVAAAPPDHCQPVLEGARRR